MLKTKIVRAFAHQIQNASTKEVKPFFDRHISTKVQVSVDKWRAYNPIKKYCPNMIQQKSKPQQNFKLLHREIMMLKAAIRGIYHHVFHLQEYLNEYFFRKNLNDKLTPVSYLNKKHDEPKTSFNSSIEPGVILSQS